MVGYFIKHQEKVTFLFLRELTL